MYKIHILNRDYSQWSIHDNNTFEIIDGLHTITPFNQKLLNEDVFNVIANADIEIINSPIRSSLNIPGVLILEGNKTYGRHNKSKLYYKCVPDDIRIPVFLVPYEIKTNFSKVFENKYVTINFLNWSQKHPIGVISQIIGNVSELNNYYEYQLYCKSLNISIQSFQKQVNKCLANHIPAIFEEIVAKYPSIETRTHLNIITIDTATTVDFDDAFSCRIVGNEEYILSIYISNVSLILDHFNLWDSFANRVATLYLPDKKRPMMPAILSEKMCSLQENMPRIAFTLDIHIKDNNIISTNYCNSLINVSKNYSYNDCEGLNSCETYLLAFEVVNKLSIKYNYVNNIRDGHDVVSYLMIFMNYFSARELMKFGNGIFRTNSNINDNVNLKSQSVVPDEVKHSLMKWNSSVSQYVNIQNYDETIFDAHIHITSPIRRLVDLLNMIQLQNNLNIANVGSEFYNSWLEKLNYINVSMKNIRKVQNECKLLEMTDRSCDKIFECYCFNKKICEEGLFQYEVYLPEIKMTHRIKCVNELEEYSKQNCKLYVFHEEDKLKKKIRIQLL